MNQQFLGKSTLQTGNEFLKFTFEIEINIYLYFYLLTYQFDTSIVWNYLQPITYHTASCSNKRVFFMLFSLLEILHLDWEARVINSWKKKMRDYKVMILMRKPVVSKRRNLVWRWDWKKKRPYLFGWIDLQITVWRRFYDNSISWSRKIIDGSLTIVCFFENEGPFAKVHRGGGETRFPPGLIGESLLFRR